MKLLGWLHRKLQWGAAPGDPYSDLAAGGHRCSCLSQKPSLEELHPHYQHHSRPLTRPPLHCLFCEDGCPKSMPEEHNPAPKEELLLQGLLAIGTLGLGPSLEGLPPPQLLRLFNSIVAAEEHPEATTESHSKPTDAEAEKAVAPESGDRNGQLSSAGARYTSLSSGYLFTKSRTTEEGDGGSGGREKEAAKREGAMARMVRKMLRRRGSEDGAAVRGGAVAAPSAGARLGDTWTTETKFYKILKMFHNKVHPLGSIARKKHTKSHKSNVQPGTAYAPAGEAVARGAPKKEGTSCCFRCRPHLPTPPVHSSLCGRDANSSREQWIKTDIDYLVLEL